MMITTNSSEYYESQQSEFIGEYAYFKGVITDVTSGLILDNHQVIKNQTTSAYDYIDNNGEYLLKTGRGDVVGYVNITLYQPDTIFVELDTGGSTETL